MPTAPEAIVVSGVYGVGKSIVTAQMADLLEERGVRYAALDLDWLSWAWSDPDDDDEALDRLMLEHLELLVGNLRRRGNDRYLLAGAVMTRAEWHAIETTMGMPVRLVRLTAEPTVIRQRLTNEPTTGRLHDARQTEEWLSEPGADEPTADLVIANDGPILDTAEAILAWSGWLEGG